MCFAQKPDIPDAPPPPLRADEENRSNVNLALQGIRKRKGRASTILTGALGDPTFGASVAAPKTVLGM